MSQSTEEKLFLSLPMILARILRAVPVSYGWTCVMLAMTLLILLVWGAAWAALLSWWLGAGIIGQTASTGWILWAVLYSAEQLEKERSRFVSLVAEQGPADAWVNAEIKKIYSGVATGLIVTAIAVGLMATVTFFIKVPPVSTAGPALWQVLFYSSFAVFSVVGGFGGSTVLLIGRFMTRYARKELEFSIFQQPFSNFQFIGLLQLRFAWITAIGFLFASGMTVSYWGIQRGTLFWLILGSVIVLGFFFGPQYGFHLKLKEKKQLELERISRMIQEAFVNSIQDSAQLSKLKDLYAISKMIEKLPVWPFDVRVLISALASGMATLAPIVIPLLQRVLFGGAGAGSTLHRWIK